MSVEYRNSILWRGEDPLKATVNPLVDKSKKVTRYFPGQTPAWAKEDKPDTDEFLAGSKKKKEAEKKESRRRRRDVGAAAIIEDAGSSRLKRLAASTGAAESSSERLLRHRRVHDARILEAAQEEEQEEVKEDLVEKKLKDEEEEEEAAPGLGELKIPRHDEISGEEEDDDKLRSLRRERARELALMKRKQEEEMLKEELPEEDEIEQEEEESEEESSEDDDPRRAALLKPVFVSKVQRETVKEREAQEKEEEAQRQKEEEKKVERKAESKNILIDTIRADQEAEAAGVNDTNENSEGELLDDDDEKNEAEEYELWKIRELKRIKRDKEERLERQKEMEMIERRRGMTDAEREADDKKLDSKANKREDAKAFNFLQKYYHRGGFFQDKATTGEEPLYNRDYHEPTAEETFDKTALPKAMQLRRGQFGKKGQVKHTHLTEADTTDMSAAWSQRNKEMAKYQSRMAGASGVNDFSRPSQRSVND